MGLAWDRERFNSLISISPRNPTRRNLSGTNPNAANGDVRSNNATSTGLEELRRRHPQVAALPSLPLGWRRKRHVGIKPRPTMRLVAVWALQRRIALSKPTETGKVGHDAGWNFPIRFGASDNNHGDHGALPQCGTISKRSAATSFLGMKSVCALQHCQEKPHAHIHVSDADSNGAVQVAECGE